MVDLQKVLQKVENTEKRRNFSLCAISPFPTVFSKGFYCRQLKQELVWERVKLQKCYDKDTGRNVCRKDEECF